MAGKEQQVAELERQAAAPTLWDSPMDAQRLLRRLAALKEEVETWRKEEQTAASLAELVAMASQEDDPALAQDLAQEAREIEERLRALEFDLLLAGPYSDRDAILAVHSGAGGTESQDWAEMLLRMYLRWAEKQRFTARVLETSAGEEAGIKSATVEVTGRHVYGWLRAEKGVHRLVRLSPFDAAHLRHTSFALVEVWPQAEEELEIQIKDEDLRIDTFRAGGHGGQNVQKVETAVRIVHLPTGVTVTCQNERSQAQNREVAFKILKARLIDLEMQRRAEEQTRLKGEHVSPGWGNQIRSYVLHPYKLVKDHRSGYETRDPQALLDGALDGALRASLLTTVGTERDETE